MNNSNSTQQSTESVFIALQGLRGLQQSVEHRPVLLGELIHYVRGSAEVNETLIREQLKTQLPLRRQFNQLLEDLRVATAPRQAQAASDEVCTGREAAGFSLKFKASKAHSDQIYIILTVRGESGMVDGHNPVIVVEREDDIERLCFPVLNEHRAQTLLLENDSCLALLRDPDAELSLI